MKSRLVVAGAIFADQPKTSRAVRKPFREVRYLEARPTDEPLPFYRALRMPRLDAVGNHFLFDGLRMNGPYEALAAIRASRNRPQAAARPVLSSIKPIDKPAALMGADGPPINI